MALCCNKKSNDKVTNVLKVITITALCFKFNTWKSLE